MKLNFLKVKVPLGTGPGTPLLPLLKAMVRNASRNLRATGPVVDCQFRRRAILETISGDTNLTYPVNVISVQGTNLGQAANTAAYIALWNANAPNRELAEILSGTGNAFVLKPVLINTVINLFASQA